MESLFEDLYQAWKTDRTDEEVYDIVSSEFKVMKSFEEHYGRYLCCMLCQAIGGKRVSILLDKLNAKQKEEFLHPEIIDYVYREGIEYMFLFIEKYLNRRFSLIYEIESYTDTSCILDHISQSRKRCKELRRCIEKFHVSNEELDPQILDPYIQE